MKAKKSLGQNFLVDQNVISKIVGSVSPKSDELILEIGPGHGALTQLLMEKAGWVIAIELDKDLVIELESRFSTSNITIIEADILSIDIKTLIKEQLTLHPQLKNKVRVVANLPYYISTAILTKLIEVREVIQDMTLMLQREVAERIASHPGNKDYGVLSVLSQLYCETRSLFLVKPGSFRPIPKVDSVILQLKVYPPNPKNLVDDRLLIKVLYGAFSQRRKTILNSLKSSSNTINHKLFPEQIEDLLRLAGITPQRRAETLNSQEFVSLTNKITQFLMQIG